MNLFEKIPENFFSILVSKNKNIYLDALFVLREAFKQEMTISRENIIARLIGSLEDEFMKEDFTDEEDRSELKDNTITSKAYFLLRKLKWAGWVEFEMQRDSFEENVILPDYSIKFLDLLYSIAQEEQVEYNSYVFATYSSLKLATIEKNETYNAINTAYHNTMQLINELKSLYNSLGRFHRKMIQQENINDIIQEHFFEYKAYSDEVIFPRFTRDSVPRYKAPIRDMLNDILTDTERLDIAISTLSKNRKISREEAETEVLSKIRSVLEVYENIDFTMNQIEQKNTDYVRASVQRIQYLLTSDKELKGKLVKLLKNSKKQAVLEKMEEEIKLLKQEWISDNSIYIRNEKDKTKQGKPLPIKSEKEIDATAFYEIAKSFAKMYSNTRIKQFMEENFKDKPFITSAEINLQTTEDLILLILSIIKADKTGKSFYYIQDNNETINNNGYKIPNMKFIRRS